VVAVAEEVGKQQIRRVVGIINARDDGESEITLV